MKRPLFRLLAVLLIAACTALWVDSYLHGTLIQYGWTPSRHPDRLIGIGFGWNRGQFQIGFASEPLVYQKYSDTLGRNIPFFPRPGYYQWTVGPWQATSWKDYLDLRPAFIHGQDSVAAYADGSIAIDPHGTWNTNAPLRLPLNKYYINMPFWIPILLLGAEPTWWLLDLPARRRRKRLAAGQCVTCGYDLRATPQGERCPECGIVEARTSNGLV